MTEVLSELMPQEEVAESESGGEEETDNAPDVVLEKNVEETRPKDKLAKKSTAKLIVPSKEGSCL